MGARIVRRSTDIPDEPESSIPAVTDLLRQWLTLRAQSNVVTSSMNALRDELADYVDQHGEPDDKGSIWYTLPAEVTHGDVSYRSIKRERRVQQFFKEDVAERILCDKGLYGRAVQTITVLDQDAIYVLNQEGALTDDDIDAMFGEKTSYAFKPVT